MRKSKVVNNANHAELVVTASVARHVHKDGFVLQTMVMLQNVGAVP